MIAVQSDVQPCEVILNLYEQAGLLLKATVLKIEGAYSPSTISAYRANFAVFNRYCEEQGTPPLPSQPQSVIKFIARLSNGHLKSESIRIVIVGIAEIHRLNGFHDPTKDPGYSIHHTGLINISKKNTKVCYALSHQLKKHHLGELAWTLRIKM